MQNFYPNLVFDEKNDRFSEQFAVEAPDASGVKAIDA